MTNDERSRKRRKKKSASKKKKRTARGGMRQLGYAEEIRIPIPEPGGSGPTTAEPDGAAPRRPASPAGTAPDEGREGRVAHLRMLAEVATCLWYLKTKHFKKAWNDGDTDADDPRERRALGRLSKGVEALLVGGVEIEDPTDDRYPPGAEAIMRPVQLVPTPGISHPRVTETIRPIVFVGGQRVQRGEVILAVPLGDEDEGRLGSDDEAAAANQEEG